MKILGFNIGQYGDLAINTVACKVLKTKFPEAKLIFAISKKYADCGEAFINNKYIDDLLILDSYDDYPSIKDVELIKQHNFNYVFNGMQDHYDKYWFLRRHQAQEICHMHRLEIPDLNDCKINLTKYWDDDRKYEKYIALAPFGSFGVKKSLSIDKIKQIIKYIKSKNYKVLLSKSKQDPEIEGVDEYTNGSYFDSIKKITSCKLFITIDTGMVWFTSAYELNTIGLYGYNYYPGCNTAKNWQPINKNAVYLENDHCNNIENRTIFNEIEKKINK